MIIPVSYTHRLNRYDKQTCKITPFPDARLLDKGINYMAADKEDNIWIGAGNTIYRCNSTASIVKEYDIFGSQQNRHAINFVYQDDVYKRQVLYKIEI